MASVPAPPAPVRALAGLYGIVSPQAESGSARQAEALAVGRAFLAGGAAVLQLRDKRSDGRALLETARSLRALTRAAGAVFVVNDRLDVALLADADGVHVGQDDLPVAEVRRCVAALGGPRWFLVGLSTHDLDQVRQGVASGADYLGFGPIHATSSKPDALSPRGCARLREAVEAAGATPIVAIGGVSRANAAELRACGAAMGAVISEVAGAAEPAVVARELHRLLS